MIGDEVMTSGLAALSVAAAELIEDHHDELVTTLPESPAAQRVRMERLRQLGADLQALAEGGLVLLRPGADQ
jgi:hypothetical protein